MARDKQQLTDLFEVVSGDSTGELKPVPAEQTIRAPQGCLSKSQAATKHGWHSSAAVQIPRINSMYVLPSRVCPLGRCIGADRRRVARSLPAGAPRLPYDAGPHDSSTGVQFR